MFIRNKNIKIERNNAQLGMSTFNDQYGYLPVHSFNTLIRRTEHFLAYAIGIIIDHFVV